MSETMKLSTASDFKSAYKRELSFAKNTGVWDGIEARLENMAIAVFGPPSSDNDQFAPPKEKVLVRCKHCTEAYHSNKMKLAYRPIFQHTMVKLLGTHDVERIYPLWWCKNIQCDGAGFGLDILEIKP